MPWVRVKFMTQPCVQHYQFPTYHNRVMTPARSMAMCAVWPWSYDLGSRSWHTFGSLTTIVWNIQIQYDSSELWPGHWLWLCVQICLDLWDITLGRGRWHTLVHGHQSCEILSKYKFTVESYSLVKDYGQVCSMEILTLVQGHDTSLGHGQQLCELLFKYNMTVLSYGPDKDFSYVCTVTLTLEIWPLVKVMTQPWVQENNHAKYYLDPT